MRAQSSDAGSEGVEVARLPGTEGAGETQTRGTALGTTLGAQKRWAIGAQPPEKVKTALKPGFKPSSVAVLQSEAQ